MPGDAAQRGSTFGSDCDCGGGTCETGTTHDGITRLAESSGLENIDECGGPGLNFKGFIKKAAGMSATGRVSWTLHAPGRYKLTLNATDVAGAARIRSSFPS
jgi:hypothetical protein